MLSGWYHRDVDGIPMSSSWIFVDDGVEA